MACFVLFLFQAFARFGSPGAGFFRLVRHENSILHFGTGNDPIGLRR